MTEELEQIIQVARMHIGNAEIKEALLKLKLFFEKDKKKCKKSRDKIISFLSEINEVQNQIYYNSISFDEREIRIGRLRKSLLTCLRDWEENGCIEQGNRKDRKYLRLVLISLLFSVMTVAIFYLNHKENKPTEEGPGTFISPSDSIEVLKIVRKLNQKILPMERDSLERELPKFFFDPLATDIKIYNNATDFNGLFLKLLFSVDREKDKEFIIDKIQSDVLHLKLIEKYAK